MNTDCQDIKVYKTNKEDFSGRELSTVIRLSKDS